MRARRSATASRDFVETNPIACRSEPTDDARNTELPGDFLDTQPLSVEGLHLFTAFFNTSPAGVAVSGRVALAVKALHPLLRLFGLFRCRVRVT